MICSFIWSSGQIVNLVPNVFPDTPTSYLELERVISSKVFVAPEDGWFEFIGLAASGKGGSTSTMMHGKQYAAGGGGGGSGGIVVCIFALHKGESVSLSVSTNVTISKDSETATATQGGVGQNGTLDRQHDYAFGGPGGVGGNASGGNTANQPGETGGRGGSIEYNDDIPVSSVYGVGAVNTYSGYSTVGGAGNNSSGSTAYIVVLRGNTNLPLSQLNALELSGLMLEMNYVFQEQTEMLMQSTQ